MQTNPLSRAKSRVHFTKKVIDELPVPAAGRKYIYDAATPGLALCIQPTGSRTWYVYRKVNSRPEREKIGRWPEWTVDQARNEAQKIAGRNVDGVTGNDAKRAKRGLPTLKEAFDVFIVLPTRTKKKRPRSAETIKGYRYQFDHFLSAWHNRRLDQITREDVEALHLKLGTDSGHYLANRIVSLVKAIYYSASKPERPVANPAAGLTTFAEESRERFLEADEMPRFWAAVEAESSEKVRDFIKLALFTGQRKTNVLQMKWADVDLARGLWIIPQTKTGRHEVPLSAPALEILNRRKAAADGSEYVLPGRHGREHLKDPMRQWRSILSAAGIQHLRIHDLRRSLGSWQTATGSNTAIVGKTLGHVRPETTAIYSRVTLQTVRESIDTAGAAILAAATAKPRKKGTRHAG
ncbi:MAG TPA: site-specific integrase [Pirellulaceae bacterium]|nr:site-specific integrase [Pirellulaceae bacterium]